LIAGKRWENWKPYEKLIKHHGIDAHVVTCLEYIPSADVHRYFCASDLVILPYHHFDSQSGVGGTAVSFRKPLIVTRVGGLPDLVVDQRAIIPPADPTALAQTIMDCLESPARLNKMANDADKIAQRISWNGIAKRTSAVYESLITKKGPKITRYPLKQENAR
jgi:glycosyltransferase involved in cell wall biosynthesis